MDVSTLLLVLGLVFGVYAYDRVQGDDTLSVSASVARPLAESGYTPAVIEQILERRVAGVLAQPSLFAPRPVEQSGGDSGPPRTQLPGGDWLDRLDFGVQTLFGQQPVHLTAGLVQDAGRMRLLVFVDAGDEVRHTVKVPAEPGETVDRLLERGALAVVRRLSPYGWALFQLRLAAHSSDFEPLETGIGDRLQVLARGPHWAEQAMLLNLLGLAALLQDDADGAADRFGRALAHEVEFAVAGINLAFTDLVRGRTEPAIARLSDMVGSRMVWNTPRLLSTVTLLRGLAHWRRGETRVADNLFAEAAEQDRSNTQAFEYWSRLQAADGQTEVAKQTLRTGYRNMTEAGAHPELALAYFTLDATATTPWHRPRSEHAMD